MRADTGPCPVSPVHVGAIECWRHGLRFALAADRVLLPQATRPVGVYGVRTCGEDVLVHLGKGERDSVAG